MKKRTLAATLLSLLLCLAGATTHPTYAEDEENADEPVKTVLELTPVTKRIAVDPGQTYENEIELKNTSDKTLSFSVYATPFSNGDGGETQDFETETTYTQISRWTTIKDGNGEYKEKAEFSLKAGKTKKVTYRIKIPENAVGGGQYESIIVELAPVETEETAQIRTISRAAMVVYASIAGDIQRSAEISEIDTQAAAIGNNIGISFTVKNKGNIDLQASGEIAVSSLFGKELYRNITLSDVFPENSKTILAEWGETPAFGIYRLDYEINALDLNTTGHRYVLVMRPLILAVFIILIIATIIAIIYLVKKHTVDKDVDIAIG